MPEITVFSAYAVAALLLVISARTNGEGVLARLAPLLALLAMIAHGWLLWRAVLSLGPANLSLGNTLSLSGWMVAALVSVYVWRPNFRGLAALFLAGAGISVLFTGSIAAAGPVGGEPLWQFVSHAVMATFSYSLLAVAAMLAITTSFKDRRLHQTGDAGWTSILPPLDDMERHMFGAITIGFVLLSLAMFSGLVFVRDLMAQHLAHKTILTALAWLIFGVLLLGRWRFGWRGRKAINWTLAGFVVLALAYFGSRLVLEVVLGRQWG
ncbi:MAG: cytochrome c biogenesis protein CcsA [Gammaproteobacteria bacterium]|nr:cytochrome c biogenesis protein CcsA [Gammaproteobacteria bacterium]